MHDSLFWIGYGLMLVGLAASLVTALRKPASAREWRSRGKSVGAALLAIGFGLQLVIFIDDRDPWKITAAAAALVLLGLIVLTVVRKEKVPPR